MVVRRLRHSVGRKGEGGFTLVELLVAVVLMAIVVVAIFGFFTSATTIFQVEEQIGDAQTTIRFGSDLLRKDFNRVGYLFTPSATNDPLVCPKPSISPLRDGSQPLGLVAIQVDDGVPADTPVVFTGNGVDNNNIFPDAVYMIGSYSLSDTISTDLVRVNSPADTEVYLDGADVLRVLGGGDTSAAQQTFDRLFSTQRLVRVGTSDGNVQIGRLTGQRDWQNGQPVVHVSGLVAKQGNVGCGVEGTGENYELALLNVVRYRVEQSTVDTTRSDLVRAELDPGSGGGVFATSVVRVVDYATDFQVWLDAVSTAPGNPQVTPDLWGDDEGNTSIAEFAQGGGSWQRARAVYFGLSVRTPREDTTLFHETRELWQSGNGTVYGPLFTFNLDTDYQGAAHVISMTSVADLPNVALRDLR